MSQQHFEEIQNRSLRVSQLGEVYVRNFYLVTILFNKIYASIQEMNNYNNHSKITQ